MLVQLEQVAGHGLLKLHIKLQVTMDGVGVKYIRVLISVVLDMVHQFMLQMMGLLQKPLASKQMVFT